ncbi:hypothetical protein E4U10_002558 [Claviceps purpurea]|nr:hypothetical protein E4U11_008554 [Claviceps purpurea]KAG6200440.1 hypothetical protein E4U10_002558 [Claviceps purpurea]
MSDVIGQVSNGGAAEVQDLSSAEVHDLSSAEVHDLSCAAAPDQAKWPIPTPRFLEIPIILPFQQPSYSNVDEGLPLI